MTINLGRWGILLKVLPLTALFCLAKWITHLMQWEIGKFDSQMGSLLAAATFILAFMLSGTLNDYRASEDMPNQIANAVETIQDTNLFIAARKPNYDPSPLTAELIEILKSVLLCLEQDKPFVRAENAITQLNRSLVPLSEFCEPPLITRLQAEQAKIRLLVARIESIRDTDFLAPAYALLQILVVASSLALLMTRADDLYMSLIVSGLLFSSFIYLLLLIYDLDNPFEYHGKSSVDVDLSVLKRSRDQLNMRLLESSEPQTSI
ncbi:hypothetical protein [Nostoc sp.]|uniref:hypothetical protein n=1 Tax=Nostoc sp. TaxID=1180 RepID=UPI002FF77FE6